MEKRNSKTSDSYRLQIILCGKSSVGKSSIISRYTDDEFTTTFFSTMGIDFKLKTLTMCGKQIMLQIWDTAGSECFHSLTSAYLRKAMGAFIVYDVTNKQSFNDTTKWMEMCKKHGPKDLEMILIGNKCDSENRRGVSTEAGKEAANRSGVRFLETSASTGENIQQAFEQMVSAIFIKHLLKLHEEAEQGEERKYLCQNAECPCPDHKLRRNYSELKLNKKDDNSHGQDQAHCCGNC